MFISKGAAQCVTIVITSHDRFCEAIQIYKIKSVERLKRPSPMKCGYESGNLLCHLQTMFTY